MRRPHDLIRFSLAFILLAVGLLSCSSPKDLYRVSYIRWDRDTIQLQVINKEVPAKVVPGLETELECLTCNFYNESTRLELNQKGEARIFIPESKQLLTTRVAVRAYGIDTVAVLLQRTPEEAEDYFLLAQPLTGRVLLLGLALFYHDSTYDSVAISGRLQDEVNIYSEQEDHYIVHHPHFLQPLYLRKLGVVRLH